MERENAMKTIHACSVGIPRTKFLTLVADAVRSTDVLLSLT